MKNTKALRQWLSEFAGRERLSQAEIARRTGKSAATYSRIMDGTTKELAQDTIDVLCELTGVDHPQLLAIATNAKKKSGSAKSSATAQKILSTAEGLSDQDQRKLLEFAQLLRRARG